MIRNYLEIGLRKLSKDKGYLLTNIFNSALLKLEIHSPFDGFVIYMLATPPVNKGEILFSLAVND
jgi:hypothetical protein